MLCFTYFIGGITEEINAAKDVQITILVIIINNIVTAVTGIFFGFLKVSLKILCYLLTLYSLSTHCSLIRSAQVIRNIPYSCQVTDKSQERSEAGISRTEAAFTTFTLNKMQRSIHKALIF